MENNEHDEENVFCSVGCERDSPSRERSPTTTMPLSPPSTRRLGYIQHSVSKFDTLVGIAIKYGVEVADIKKMNGLITDRQMFALKTIHIPLPGRHPPSPCLPSGSGNAGVKSFGQKVSPAMSSLQGYYGLKSASNYVQNGSTKSDRTLANHRKSRSLVNVILEEIMEKTDIELAARVREEGNSDKWNDKLVQRRLKSEADFTRIPELLLKEDTSSSAGLLSRTGNSLALRSKSINRTTMLTIESESSGLSPVVTGMGDAFLATDGVRKSSSTSCLHDQDNSSSSSYIWPTSMWSLKPDIQSFPKPTTSRRNKAALD